MRVVIQRSKQASVTVENQVIGQIERGYVVLFGVCAGDTIEDVKAIVQKLIHLRIFEDETGKMNLSLLDIEGSVLSVSQFTLYADIRKGRRPNFMDAAQPDVAEALYEQFNRLVKAEGIHVETGEFGAMMEVSLINDGPVTIIVETEEGKIIK